jgi:hypothetical protein
MVANFGKFPLGEIVFLIRVITYFFLQMSGHTVAAQRTRKKFLVRPETRQTFFAKSIDTDASVEFSMTAKFCKKRPK